MQQVCTRHEWSGTMCRSRNGVDLYSKDLKIISGLGETTLPEQVVRFSYYNGHRGRGRSRLPKRGWWRFKAQKADSDAPAETAVPPAKRRLDSDLDPAAPVIIFSGSGLDARLINCGLTLAQAEEAVAALEQLGSADESIAEVAALSVAELGRAPLVVALCDAGAVTAAIAAHRAHASNLRIACCMASFLDAALNAKADVSGEAAAAAVDGCLSALRHHAADRQVAVHAWSAIGAVLVPGGDSAVASFRNIGDAGVRTLQVLGSDVEVCRAACDAMSCLVEESGEAAAAARAGGAAELLLQLLERHKASAAVAASCCRILGAVKSSLPGISKAVLEAAARHKGDNDVAAAIGAAIAQLAVTPTAADELLAAGAAEALVASLQREGASSCSLTAGCRAVRSLAAQGGTARLLATGAAPAIASAVRDTDDLDAAMEGLRAVEELGKMVEQSPPQWPAWRSSGIELSLLRLLERFPENVSLCRLCCQLLSALSVDAAEAHQPTAKASALAVLAAAGRHTSDEVVVEAACTTLWRASAAFCEDEAFLGTLVEAGGADILCEAAAAFEPFADMRFVDDERVLQSMLAAAEVLYRCPQARSAERVGQLFRVFLAALGVSRTPATVTAACKFIAQRSADGLETAARLVDIEAGQAFVEAMEHWSLKCGRTAGYVCSALWSLCRAAAEDDTLIVVLIESGLPRAIANVASSPAVSAESKTDALRGLRKLLDAGKQLDLSVSLAHHAAAAAFAVLSTTDVPHLHARHGCAIFAQLCSDPSLATALLHAGAMDVLVSAGGRHRDDYIIAADLCSAVGRLAIAAASFADDEASMPATELLADGSAAALVLTCLEKHASPASVDPDAEDDAAAAHVAPAALEALQRLALSRSVRFHGPTGVDRIIAIVCGVAVRELPDEDEDSDDEGAPTTLMAYLGPASLTLALLGKAMPAASAACASAILSLPQAAQSQHLCAALYWSAAHGPPSQLRTSLANGGSRVRDSDSWALLIELAAFRGSPGGTDIVLRRCTDAEQSSMFIELAARIAASRGNLELLEHLLSNWRADPAANGSKLLSLAAGNGHLAVVERLLQEEAVYPVGEDYAALWLAARNGHAAVVDRLLAHRSRAGINTAILEAASEGHLPVLARLLASNIDCPHDGWQLRAPLAAAARSGHIDVVRALLEDPRVDAAEFVQATLDDDTPGRADLPPSSWFALQCRPAVLRVIMQNGSTRDESSGLPTGFAPASVRDLLAAAWRRRRAAVLAWATA